MPKPLLRLQLEGTVTTTTGGGGGGGDGVYGGPIEQQQQQQQPPQEARVVEVVAAPAVSTTSVAGDRAVGGGGGGGGKAAARSPQTSSSSSIVATAAAAAAGLSALDSTDSVILAPLSVDANAVAPVTNEVIHAFREQWKNELSRTAVAAASSSSVRASQSVSRAVPPAAPPAASNSKPKGAAAAAAVPLDPTEQSEDESPVHPEISPAAAMLLVFTNTSPSWHSTTSSATPSAAAPQTSRAKQRHQAQQQQQQQPRAAAASTANQPQRAPLQHHDLKPPPPQTARTASSADSSSAAAAASNSSHEPSARDRAWHIYRLASKYEREGNLSKALTAYRDAAKLYPDIDGFARDKVRESADAIDVPPDKAAGAGAAEADDSFQTYYSFKHREVAVDPLIASMGDLEVLHYWPKRDEEDILLALLPSEIVVQILKWSLWYDMSSLVSISVVCKKLYAETRSPTLWKSIVSMHHPPPLGSPSLDVELPLYGNDWLQMWLDRPRLRYNGVYISRINYVRQGYSQSTNSPFLVVTYFRYLRLFPDNTLMCWTTTLEPQFAVKDLIPGARHQKGMSIGSFTLVGTKVLVSTRDPEYPRNRFYWTLSLSSTRRGRHNKLQWVEYYHERDHRPETRTEILSSQLKPYVFSRVRSYE
ncbi:hypothetical protein DFJ73DRAFT_893536 [Zopfochytrium polystomum]|nr:hypothetical protein DFJ73DRAFT_893536 [Zopfochytrium polystomum]